MEKSKILQKLPVFCCLDMFGECKYNIQRDIHVQKLKLKNQFKNHFSRNLYITGM